MSTNSTIRTIHWFRKGLRLHDNPALTAAATGKSISDSKQYKVEYCLPIFILDPWFVKTGKVGKNRMQFLLESLQDIDKQLRTNYKSRLLVFQGKPHEILPQLWEKYKIDMLTFERDSAEAYSLQRDAQICDLAKKHKVHVWSPVSQTLYDPEVLRSKITDKKSPPLQYKSFLTLAAKACKDGEPEKPIDPPEPGQFASVPTDLQNDEQYNPPASLDQIEYPGGAISPNEHTPYYGGETLGLERLKNYLKNKKQVIKFQKPDTRPTAFNPPDTTVLSPYVKFGCVSARKFYWDLRAVLDEYDDKEITKPPVSLVGQLMWREFFYLNNYLNPGFSCMKDNESCLQIPWSNVEQDKTAKKHFEAWRDAKTGYPFIDACMTQLRTQGYLHHLARHAVACFLTRGDLWISWEMGAKVFEELLLDHDPALNFANWMWLSASCFFHEYFRVYSPVAFPKKTDPTGEYVKHFLPVLKNLPDKYIYEPWKAPLSVQQKAKCIIGKDYPSPIVDHSDASTENKAKMKKAYAEKKYGTCSPQMQEDRAEAIATILQLASKWPSIGNSTTAKTEASTTTSTTVVRSRKRTAIKRKRDEISKDDENPM